MMGGHYRLPLPDNQQGEAMSITKKLYALNDSEASELRQIVDRAQDQALTDQDGVTYEDLTYLMILLNTPLDHDAAVERMTRAILQRAYGGNVDLLSYDAWGVARGDARAILAALLGGGDDA